MFKNRALQMTLVNIDKNAPAPAADIVAVDPELIAKIATEFATKTITTIGIAFAANRVLKTVCEIAVVAAKTQLK